MGDRITFVIPAGSCGSDNGGEGCPHAYDGSCHEPGVRLGPHDSELYDGRPAACPLGQGPLRVTVEGEEVGNG